MREFLPLLIAFVATVVLAMRSRPKEGWIASTVRSYRKRPVATTVWSVLLPALLVGVVVGPTYLAEQLYDTPSPSGDQIRTARAIIGAVIVAPFVILFGWMWWQSRGAETAWVKRRQGARLDDPSKRSQKDER